MRRRRPRQRRRARSPSTSRPASRTARASGSPARARRACAAGPPGDLYIFLSIKPHAFFQRDGADIFCRVPVSFTTAALGGQFEVPTVDGGRTRVKVPDGAQTGRQFRLKGKGMPVLRSRQVGDMYVQIVVETPQNLSRRQRELLEEFERVSERGEQSGIGGLLLPREGFFRDAGGEVTAWCAPERRRDGRRPDVSRKGPSLADRIEDEVRFFKTWATSPLKMGVGHADEPRAGRSDGEACASRSRRAMCWRPAPAPASSRRR